MTVDILLVSPQMDMYDFGKQEKLKMPPLCLGYLAAPLVEEGYRVKIIDMAVKTMNIEELVRTVRRESPEIVGITATTPSYSYSMKVAEAIKKDNPNVTVILGGSHATARPVQSMEEISAIDILVFREGDYSLVELAKTIIDRQGALETIKGILFRRDDGTVTMTPPRPFIKNLDALPLPAFHLFSLDLYLTHPVSGGRGCPHRCIFCAAGHISGHTYRFRSAENVLRELKYAHDSLGVRSFFFTDDTFTFKKDRTLQICEGIKKEGLDIEWFCEARANTVSKEMLEKMRDAGCTSVQYGVESGSQRILDSIKKGITAAQVKRAVTDLVDVGIRTLVCSFMIGHPEDTVETVQESFEFAKSLRRLPAERGSSTWVGTPFNVTIPFPGTYLYENAESLGVEILADSWERYTANRVMIRTKYLDEKALKNLWFEAQVTVRGGFEILGD